MADTTVQNEVAEWIRSNVLPKRYGGRFQRNRVPLSTGGDHSFAGVSADGTVVGSITTGKAANPVGKLAVGKLNKVRADLYFLMLAECQTRFLAVTGPVMYRLLRAEQEQYHRIPDEVDIFLVDLPRDLEQKLVRSQMNASAEVRPA